MKFKVGDRVYCKKSHIRGTVTELIPVEKPWVPGGIWVLFDDSFTKFYGLATAVSVADLGYLGRLRKT